MSAPPPPIPLNTQLPSNKLHQFHQPTTKPSNNNNCSPSPSESRPDTSTTKRRSTALKWGLTRKSKHKSKPDPKKPDFTTYYTESEQASLRAKGINPALKAEMEWSKARSEGKGFWGKLAGTALGGGWIK